ncbi:MAG: hypothetical protein ACFFDK_06780 [Promethearchaeota archaeon]
MGLMDLTVFEMLQGGLSFIYVLICTILGLKITSKYFEFKRRELLMVGFVMIFMGSGWWGTTISFIAFVLFDSTIESTTYFLFNYGFLALVLICWIYAFCHLVYPHLKRQLVTITSIICILWEIFFIYFLFENPNIIGNRVGKFDIEAGLYVTLYIASILAVIFITIFKVFIQCQKSEMPKIQWEGRFLLI